MMDSDGFIPVKYSKKRTQRPKFNSSATGADTPLENVYEPTVNYCKETALRKITSALTSIEDSLYYLSFIEHLTSILKSELDNSLQDIVRIVCYGLGSLCTTTKAIEQFALLVTLQKKLQVPMEFYDPIFTDTDKSIIGETYEYEVLQVNEEGRRKVEELTLFCLPHCPHMLSNNLLFANWSPLNLKNCVIISNGFAKVLDNTRRPQLPPFDYIFKAKPLTKEQQIVNNFVPIDVFNDFSIHVFPTHNNSEILSSDLWNHCSCPREEYSPEDCSEDELIRK